MAVTLIAETDGEKVRAVLDIRLTAEMVPDSTIMLDPFAGAAVRAIKSADPSWATRTETELERLRAATVYYTAANMVYALPFIVSENVGGYSYDIKAVDPAVRAAQLRALGDSELAAVTLSTELDPYIPTVFTTAPGGRGV